MIAAVTERDYDASRKSAGRANARDLTIPKCLDPIRRRDCLADPFQFLPVYMPDKFNRRFTADRKRIVDEILYRIEFGGQKALAAPRGRGKTTTAEGTVGIFAILKGLLRFPVIVGATSEAADQILANIKWEFERNDLLLADFPEVCVPIRALEGWSSRANMQTVGGQRTHLKWTTDRIILPTVDGSLASGAIIDTRSIDGAIRGLRVGNQRPDFILIDDPETRGSAKSAAECEKRESTIEKDIGGLGGPDKSVSKLILTTCMNCTSVSFRYTDPKQKPAYAGERMKAVDQWPVMASDLWDKYVEMRRDDKENGDVEARESHAFYLLNRAVMDEGAIVTDDEAFDRTETPDGSPREVSAIQHVYNLVADHEWEYVLTELQNAPPAESTDDGIGLTVPIVRGSHAEYRGRCNGMRKGELPAGGILVAFIDVGDNFLTWEVRHSSGHVIDYGKTETVEVAKLGIKVAIPEALDTIWRYFKAQAYSLACGLIDSGSGLHTEIVYAWIARTLGPWYPSKGSSRYVPPKIPNDKAGRKTSLHWNFSPQQGCPRALVVMDPDYWKKQAHNEFLLPPLAKDGRPAPGAVRLFGDEPHAHSDFAKDIVAEEFVREFTEKGWKESWIQTHRSNHYLDAHYGCLVALSVAGMLARIQSRPAPKYGVLSKGV